MSRLELPRYAFETTTIKVRCSEKNTVDGKTIQEVLDDAKSPGSKLLSWRITIPDPEDENLALIELNRRLPDWLES